MANRRKQQKLICASATLKHAGFAPAQALTYASIFSRPPM